MGDGFYAYVAESIEEPGYYYKGHCADLRKRLKEHNSGMTRSIKGRIPFRIVHYQAFQTLKEAIAKEKYWKTAAGRRDIKKILSEGPVVQWIE